MVDQARELESFLDSIHSDIEKKIDEIITDRKILMILEGGKRLRPLLASISFKACPAGNGGRQGFVPMGFPGLFGIRKLSIGGKVLFDPRLCVFLESGSDSKGILIRLNF